MATSSKVGEATTALSCCRLSSRCVGACAASRAASSANSSLSARQISSTRDSGISPPGASMRLTLDSDRPNCAANAA